MEKEQKFRANRADSYVNVQVLGMYVVFICSLELLFVVKAITGRIRKEGM